MNPALCHLAIKPVLVQALTKGLPKLDVPDLSPGEYPCVGDTTISLSGTVAREEPTQARKEWRPDWPGVLSVLLIKLGVADEGTAAGLLVHALQQVELAVLPASMIDALKAALDRHKAAVSARLPKIERAGAVRWAGELEIVRFVPAVG